MDKSGQTRKPVIVAQVAVDEGNPTAPNDLSQRTQILQMAKGAQAAAQVEPFDKFNPQIPRMDLERFSPDDAKKHSVPPLPETHDEIADRLGRASPAVRGQQVQDCPWVHGGGGNVKLGHWKIHPSLD